MYCDPKNPTLLCPDVYCPNSNLTFTVCGYSSSKDSNTNKTTAQFNSCPDINSYPELACSNIKNCFLAITYGMRIPAVANNTDSTASNGRATKYVARCEIGRAPDESYIRPNISSSTTSSATAITIDTNHTLMYAPLLILLYFITLFMNRTSSSTF